MPNIGYAEVYYRMITGDGRVKQLEFYMPTRRNSEPIEIFKNRVKIKIQSLCSKAENETTESILWKSEMYHDGYSTSEAKNHYQSNELPSFLRSQSE